MDARLTDRLDGEPWDEGELLERAIGQGVRRLWNRQPAAPHWDELTRQQQRSVLACVREAFGAGFRKGRGWPKGE